jgi:glycine/D-amino acid oxidase-like deaminating enzyme
MPDLVFGWKKRLREMGWLIEEAFDYQQLVVHPEAVFYKNFRASGVIFCEGARALHNPFFNYLPFSVTKGEAMIVHIPGAGFTKILKRHVFIVPLENPEALQTAGLFLKNMPDLYWVGSTSRFEFEGTEPTSEQQTSLESDLKDVVKLPFEVVARLAGIRPTVYQQRPFLGRHPTLPNLLIFNGLGTKGASQGPFLAKQMADFLLGKGGVEEEVDISRFLPKE